MSRRMSPFITCLFMPTVCNHLLLRNDTDDVVTYPCSRPTQRASRVDLTYVQTLLNLMTTQIRIMILPLTPLPNPRLT